MNQRNEHANIRRHFRREAGGECGLLEIEGSRPHCRFTGHEGRLCAVALTVLQRAVADTKLADEDQSGGTLWGD